MRDQSYVMAVAPSHHTAAGSASSPAVMSPLQPGSPPSGYSSLAHRVSADETMPR